jgi:MarR-like DNA-binding transcriptional regulator SgrR of sgrS sRNA
LHNKDLFTLRRSQIVNASARDERGPVIARVLRCDEQMVRNAIHKFEAEGMTAFTPQSSRPHYTQDALLAAKCESLKALLHHSPRDFGK